MNTKGKSNNAVGCLMLLVLGIVIYFVTTSGGTHSSDPKIKAWVCAQQAVEEKLKAPSTAKYPWYDKSYVTSLGGDRYKISAYVDSQNGFGAMIRTDFVVTLELTEKGFKNYKVSFY